VPPAIGIPAYLALYVALDWVSLVHPFGALAISPWNPPAGLTFALFLRHGFRFVPVAFVAVVLADFVLRGLAGAPAATIAAALAIAGGYALAAHALRRRARLSLRLDRQRDIIWLLAAAILAPVAVGAVVVALFCLAGLVGWAAFLEAAVHFWVGDVLGIAVLAPFLLLLLEGRLHAALAYSRLGEYALQLLAIGAALWIVFGIDSSDHFEFSYVLFLPLIWIGLRGGLAAATCGIVVTQLGLVAAIQLKGGYEPGTVAQFQLLLLAVAITGLLLGAVVDAEQRLKLRERELAQVARIAATGEMAASLAHELNQPLTALIGFARACQNLLGSERIDREKARLAAAGLIDQVVQQALRAGEIIRRTRAFLGRGEMQQSRLHIPDAIETVLDLLRAELLHGGVRLAKTFEDRLPAVMADRIQIEQVLVNLVRNGIEAVKESGDRRPPGIELRARVAPDEPGFVEIAVADTGPGFPAEIADRLFMPFAGTKEGGMGLGLSISRSIVEAHGGRIWTVPAGRGAEIRFTLPIYSEPSEDA
jgi:signal transduction histidine kinase